jgi:4-aminobutyrate aminotransferase/(S)-3-amino-2-methylpropionate transaminase
MDAAPLGGLGGTYSGNPVACEAALGALQEIEENDLLTRARDIESVMLPALLNLQQRHAAIGDVRGRGAMLAIEIVEGDRTPDPETTGRVARHCHSQGLLVLTAGSYGNVLRFLPPLTIPHHLLAEGLQVLADALAAEA